MSNTRLIVFEDQLGVGIVGMDWNTIGHLPGDWERLGPAHVFRLDALGNDVWVRELDTWWSNMDIAVMDIDADGAWEVVATGPGATGDGLWRLSLDSGRAEGFIGTSPWKVLRGPVFCPLHNGERTLAVLPVQSDDGHDRGALVMYEFPVRFNAPSGSAQC